MPFKANSKSARKHGAEIYFEDEAGVRSDHHSGTTRFMTFTGRFNGEVFIDFLQRLIHNKKEIIFLILDGHPVHKAAKVKRFVESTKGQLQLFYLPPYSPELNPDELVWNNLKNKLGRSLIKGPDDLKEKVYKIMKTIQANIDLVAAFFNEPNLRYAL